MLPVAGQSGLGRWANTHGACQGFKGASLHHQCHFQGVGGMVNNLFKVSDQVPALRQNPHDCPQADTCSDMKVVDKSRISSLSLVLFIIS